MNYNVQIKVMPLKDLLDPQGKAVMGSLQKLRFGRCAGCAHWQAYYVADRCAKPRATRVILPKMQPKNCSPTR